MKSVIYFGTIGMSEINFRCVFFHDTADFINAADQRGESFQGWKAVDDFVNQIDQEGEFPNVRAAKSAKLYFSHPVIITADFAFAAS
ncbi:MAG: hypothetical protein Kow0042_10850 [Calditrichia bacterium]